MRTAIIVLVVLFAATAFAQTVPPPITKLTWDRNIEPDVTLYRVYLCPTAGCTVTISAALLQLSTVPQPAVGIRPEWLLPKGITGVAGVTAVTISGYESPLSNTVSFNTAAPKAPTGVRPE